MGNKASKFSDNKTAKSRDNPLSEYLEYLYNEKVCFKRGAKEVEDVTSSVVELVRRIIQMVDVIDKRFTISNIHSVGSMAEGTRISEPDEFDFLVVVDKLSIGAGLTLSRNCHGDKGSVHINIDRSNKNVVKNWKDISVKGKLKSTKSRFFKKGLKQIFFNVLQKAVWALVGGNREISKDAGVLKIADTIVTQHGPACLLKFLWIPAGLPKQLSISVDITPALRCTDVESVIASEEVASDVMYSCLKEANEFLVIPCGTSTCAAGKCFKLTFTLLELRLMKGLSDHHLKCYKLMKYLFNCPNSDEGKYAEVFHSYALKTILLKHTSNGQCSERELNLCVLQLIDDIEKCLNISKRLCFVPNTILPLSNVLSNKHIPVQALNRCSISLKAMKYTLHKIATARVPESREEMFKNFRKQPLPKYFSCVKSVPLSIWCRFMLEDKRYGLYWICMRISFVALILMICAFFILVYFGGLI